MASWTHLAPVSILSGDKDHTDSFTSQRSTLNFTNPYSHSISTGLEDQSQDIELRKRPRHSNKLFSQDVSDSRLSPLPSTRETSRHESQRDSSSKHTATHDSGGFQWVQHVSTPTTKYRFERDALLRFNPDITVSLDGNCSSSGPHVRSKIAKFHAQITGIRRATPDIILRSAASQDTDAAGINGLPAKRSSPIAVAHFRWSRHVRMGFGADPAISPNDVAWEEMRNTSKWYMHNRYEFSITLCHDLTALATSAPESDSSGLVDDCSSTDISHNIPFSTSFSASDGDNGRIHLLWVRTSSSADGVTSFWQRLSMMNYKLIQIPQPSSKSRSNPAAAATALVETGPCLATFLFDHTSFRTRGTLQIHTRLPPDLEVAVVLSCLAINEKAWRRRCGGYKGVTAGP